MNTAFLLMAQYEGKAVIPRLAGMPGLFLAPAREQVDPKIDCGPDTDSPRANGSKPEVR